MMLVIGLSIMSFINAPQSLALDYNQFVEDLADQVDLPTYEDSSDAHGEAFREDGLQEVTSAIYYLIDFVKYILGSVAVLYIVISSYQILMAGDSSDEELGKQKTYMLWAIVGLILVFAADTVVKEMFFGEQGEILAQDEDTTLAFAARASRGIEGMYTLIEVFVGAIAVFAIAYDGVRMITVSFNDEEVTAARNHIFWSIIGLMLIGVSELLIRDILFPYEPGESMELGISEGRMLLASLTNFLAGIIGFMAVVMFIAAGYMYVTEGASEGNIEKAKKLIMGAVGSILLAGGAFAIATTLLSVPG